MEYDAEIEALNKRIRELQEKRHQRQCELSSMTPAQIVAEALHKKLCNADHTEGCGWYYEEWSQSKTGARARWTHKAQNMLNVEPNSSKLLKIIAEM